MHSHDHAHHHDHAPKLDHLNAAFIWGIILNSAFVVIEVIYGLLSGSLALLTDAGHNLSDVASLALALLAFKLAKAKSNKNYTYGFKRSTIIVSFFNAVILVIAVGFIIYEAIVRFMHPEPLAGGTIAWVALAGIAVNGFTAWLFVKDKDSDLNVKGAYLHMAVDAIVSLVIVFVIEVASTDTVFAIISNSPVAVRLKSPPVVALRSPLPAVTMFRPLFIVEPEVELI